MPAEEFDAFMSCLKQPLGVSFRITGHQDDPETISPRAHGERPHLATARPRDAWPAGGAAQPIAWYPGRRAWRLDVASALRGKGTMKNNDGSAPRATSPLSTTS